MASGKSNRSIVGQSKGRTIDDYYPTPREATLALLAVETFHGTVWEPACGDGAISKVLKEHGLSVISTDVVDRGYGMAGIDFLLDYSTSSNHVITNPPFILAQEFVEHALRRTDGKVALFLKLVFLEGERRQRLFKTTPLARVWVFSKRLRLPRHGGSYARPGMIAFAWFVWEHGYEGAPTLGWL